MPNAKRLIAAIVGTIAIAGALAFAAWAGGPCLRAVFGPPAGFGTDVTSQKAYLQAVVAQISCSALALSFLGLFLGQWAGLHDWRSSLWISNPVTVGLGYWLFRQIAAPNWPYEYTAYHGWVVVSLLAPILFAPLVCMGARFRWSG